MTTLRAGDEQERGGWIAAGVAVAVRLAVAAWAGPRFPASADGFYYDTLARRLARAPAKLAVTFDYLGAGPWYLHEANPRAFDEHAKVALGVVETAVTYVLLLAALARVGLSAGPRRGLRLGIVTAGVVLGAASLHGWVAYAALAAAIGAFGRRWLARAPLLVPWTAVVIVLTAATHVAFFGAGRYGLVIVPFVTALAFVRPRAAEA